MTEEPCFLKGSPRSVWPVCVLPAELLRGLPQPSQGLGRLPELLERILSCKPKWILLLPLTTPSDTGLSDLWVSTIPADLSWAMLSGDRLPYFVYKSPDENYLPC